MKELLQIMVQKMTLYTFSSFSPPLFYCSKHKEIHKTFTRHNGRERVESSWREVWRKIIIKYKLICHYAAFASHSSLYVLFLNLILSQTSLLVFISRKINYSLVCLCKHDNIYLHRPWCKNRKWGRKTLY